MTTEAQEAEKVIEEILTEREEKRTIGNILKHKETGFEYMIVKLAFDAVICLTEPKNKEGIFKSISNEELDEYDIL